MRTPLLFCFFVHFARAAPTAKLFELNFALNFFPIFSRPVIDVLAGATLEFDKIILAHGDKGAENLDGIT